MSDIKPAPVWRDGVPACDETCGLHDGKRCMALGLRAPQTCEPVVAEMTRLLDESRAMLRDAADGERRAARMYQGGVISEGNADGLADDIDELIGKPKAGQP